MSFRRALIAGVLALAGVASACSNEGSTPKSAAVTTTTVPGPPGVAMGAKAWTNSAITPVTSVVALGGRFLVYGSNGAQLTLYGLDPATGRVSWQRLATRGDAARGIPLMVTTVGDAVVYLRPAANAAQGQYLVAADPATGVDRWVSSLAVFDTLPEDCGDGKHVCGGVESVGVFSFALTDGARKRLDVPSGARGLATALYDFGRRSPETFGVVSPTGRAWSHTINEIFGPNHSTDGGWDFERYKSDGVYVASVGATPPEDGSPPVTSISLTDTSTVGLDASSGKKLWTIPTSYVACHVTLYVSSNPGGQGPPLPVICTYAGKASLNKSGGISLSGPTTVSGFDVRTGAIRWSWKSNDDVSLFDSTSPHVQVDDASVVLPNEAGALFILNLLTGKSQPVAPATAGWCVTSTIYAAGPADPQNPGSNQAAGGNLARPCTADGKDGGAPALLPHGIGATVGSVVAYAQASGVTAFAVK